MLHPGEMLLLVERKYHDRHMQNAATVGWSYGTLRYQHGSKTQRHSAVL